MKSFKILALALLLPALPGMADTCQDLKDRIDTLSNEIGLARQDLQDLPPAERAGLESYIKSLSNQIVRLNRQLRMTVCEQ